MDIVDKQEPVTPNGGMPRIKIDADATRPNLPKVSSDQTQVSTSAVVLQEPIVNNENTSVKPQRPLKQYTSDMVMTRIPAVTPEQAQKTVIPSPIPKEPINPGKGEGFIKRLLSKMHIIR